MSVVTEKEAKKMRCLLTASGAACKGSECMAWRWANAWLPEKGGYCGLAGKPMELEQENYEAPH